MLDREELKTIISTLQNLLAKIEEFTPCSKCTLPVAARGLCSKHYSQWRREFCQVLRIKKLGDQPKLVEPDPRQAHLFSDTPPDITSDQLLKDIEF